MFGSFDIWYVPAADKPPNRTPAANDIALPAQSRP